MKRSRSIRLVLLGGGVLLGLSACGEGEQERLCRLARAENRPDAEQLCARSRATSSSGSHGGSWYYGRTGGYGGAYGRASAGDGRSAFAGRTATSTVSRSGFGSTGARSGGG